MSQSYDNFQKFVNNVRHFLVTSDELLWFWKDQNIPEIFKVVNIQNSEVYKMFHEAAHLAVHSVEDNYMLQKNEIQCKPIYSHDYMTAYEYACLAERTFTPVAPIIPMAWNLKKDNHLVDLGLKFKKDANGNWTWL